MTGIVEALSGLVGVSQGLIWSAFLVFLRVGAAMALLPAFGEQSVPQRVRLILAIAFTLIVFPSVAPRVSVLESGALPFLTEVAAGLLIGIGLRLFVLALQIAGTMAGQSASLSQMFGGAGPEPQPAFANLFVMAGIALAVMAGLHVRAAELLILSYDILPPGVLMPGADVADWGLSQVTHAFALGFTLAAPFVLASVVYNIALGVINRAMPQLMVAMVGAPALTLGGLVLLAIATPLLLRVWMQALDQFLAAPFAVSP